MKNVTLIFFLLILLMSSCYKKSNGLTITDFSKPIYDTLIPLENSKIAPYSNAKFEIKGYANDSVYIEFYGTGDYYKQNFKIAWNRDYYGQSEIVFKFEPYKATKGRIEVEYGIH